MFFHRQFNADQIMAVNDAATARCCVYKICINFGIRAIAPIQLHVKPPFESCKSCVFQKVVGKHAATARFWKRHISWFSETSLLCSFNTHFAVCSTNIKMSIDLSATRIGAPGCKLLFPKPYPISHIQKPMNFYHFAILRDSTIVLTACLMLLKPFFWIA